MTNPQEQEGTGELLPCPFCGSREVRAVTRPDGIFSYVFCGPCGAQGPVEAGSANDGTPEDRWNRRAALRPGGLEAQLTEARNLVTHYAREAGEATGRLETSEAAGIVDGWRERAEAAESRIQELEAEREALWGWLASRRNLELGWGETDEGEAAWRVHRISGGANDREWEFIASGDTPMIAVLNSRAALTKEGKHEG